MIGKELIEAYFEHHSLVSAKGSQVKGENLILKTPKISLHLMIIRRERDCLENRHQNPIPIEVIENIRLTASTAPQECWQHKQPRHPY